MKNELLCLAIFFTACNDSASKQTRKDDPKTADVSKQSMAPAPTYTPPPASSSYTESTTPPYEMMHVAFEGMPDEEKIKPMMEAVIKRYNMPLTDESRIHVANMLVSLRKESAVGVTEIQILKHIYQNYSPKVSLPDQAGLSATLLELNN